MRNIDFYKMSILGNCIEQMSADAEDKGEETFGIRLSLEDARMITHSMIFYHSHHWIPVSERLPKASKHILFSVKGKSCTSYGYYNDGGIWTDINGAWYTDREVIAWMPLPEPYKESD